MRARTPHATILQSLLLPHPPRGQGHTVHTPSVPSPRSKARVNCLAPHKQPPCPFPSRRQKTALCHSCMQALERTQRNPATKLTRLTPSMAFLRGRVWETNAASQSCILGPRVRFNLPAPAREQSLPRARDTPEPRCPTCPTWGAAPPSPRAGAFPALPER